MIITTQGNDSLDVQTPIKQHIPTYNMMLKTDLGQKQKVNLWEVKDFLLKKGKLLTAKDEV